jgi:hypothetical protein
MLQNFVNEHRDDWDEYLNFVLFAYRTAVHHSTQYSPFFLLYGRQARQPSSLDQIRDKYGDYSNLNSYAIDILQKFNTHYKYRQQRSTKSKVSQKENRDKKRSDVKVRLNDIVWLKIDNIVGKLSFKNDGPYRVTKIRNNVCDIVHCDNADDTHRVNISKLTVQPDSTLRRETSSTDVKMSPAITPPTEIKKRPKTKIDESLVNILTDAYRKISDDPSTLRATKKIFNQLLGRGSQLVKSFKQNDYFTSRIKNAITPTELRSFIKEVIDGAGAPSSKN